MGIVSKSVRFNGSVVLKSWKMKLMQEWIASMAFYSFNSMSIRADMGNIPAVQIAQPCFWHTSELHVCPAVPQRALQSDWEWPLNPIQYHQADLCQSGTDWEQMASVTRETRSSWQFQTTNVILLSFSSQNCCFHITLGEWCVIL